MANVNDGDEKYPQQALTREIIAAAYEVHGELGGGFLEKVYESALVIELTGRGLKVMPQAQIEVQYKDDIVGTYYADLLVNDAVICEIKAVSAIASAHQAQLLNYLKATGKKVGLLLNFGAKRVDVKRMVF